MSRDIEHIKRELMAFSGRYGPAAILPATIKTVNDDTTVSVELSNGEPVEDVRLKSVVKDGNQFLLIPSVGSIVQIGRLEDSEEYIIVAVDEVSSVQLVIGSVKLEADDAGFIIEKGASSLKELINLVIEAVEQIVVVQGNNPNYNKLIQAKQQLNNLFK